MFLLYYNNCCFGSSSWLAVIAVFITSSMSIHKTVVLDGRHTQNRTDSCWHVPGILVARSYQTGTTEHCFPAISRRSFLCHHMELELHQHGSPSFSNRGAFYNITRLQLLCLLHVVEPLVEKLNMGNMDQYLLWRLGGTNNSSANWLASIGVTITHAKRHYFRIRGVSHVAWHLRYR